MDLTFRQATVDDAHAIARVHVASWKKAYRGQLPDELLDDLSVDARTSRWKKILSDPAGGSRALVAEDDAEVLGFASFGRTRDADEDSTRVAEISAIYIHPDAWRQGIGGELLDRSLTELEREGFEVATLWVLESNRRGRDFYEAKGWRDDGGRKVDERPNVTFHEMRYRTELD